jgi:four helix bundle protein
MSTEVSKNHSTVCVKKYDLARRTTRLSIQTLLLLQKIPLTSGNQTVVRQLTSSVTNIGANYLAADCAESRADFLHTISLCQRDAKESQYWLQMLAEICTVGNEYRAISREVQELIFIFSSIRMKVKKTSAKMS